MKKDNHIVFKMKSSPGFTLIELIIIIIVTGIFAGVAIYKFHMLDQAAHATACIANQNSLNIAHMAYYAHGNGHAAAIAELASFCEGDALPECPDDGIYSIGADGFIHCSIAKH